MGCPPPRRPVTSASADQPSTASSRLYLPGVLPDPCRCEDSPIPDRDHEMLIGDAHYRTSKAPDGRVGSVEEYEANGKRRLLWDLLSRRVPDNVVRQVLMAGLSQSYPAHDLYGS